MCSIHLDRATSGLAPAAPFAAGLVALLAGCASPGGVAEPSGMGPTEARAAIVRLLPPNTDDRAGWAVDVYAALATLELLATAQNICAVLAVTEQGSGFRADPALPGLAAIAWKAIDRRADPACVPKFAVLTALAPPGKTFFAGQNPVRTGGPMQVSIAFAEAYAQARPYPYPVRESVRREVFTRRGGLYFGTAHLLAYDAPYDKLLYLARIATSRDG
jgi:hypothetical protein